MKIRKAMKKAVDLGCGLTRKCWKKEYREQLYIQPVGIGSHDVQVWISGQIKAAGWQPTAGDLIATDWCLVKK